MLGLLLPEARALLLLLLPPAAALAMVVAEAAAAAVGVEAPLATLLAAGEPAEGPELPRTSWLLAAACTGVRTSAAIAVADAGGVGMAGAGATLATEAAGAAGAGVCAGLPRIRNLK